MTRSGTAPTVIELFAGAGGTSFGFKEAGFDVRLGLDFDPIAATTFGMNHPGAAVLPVAIETVDGRHLLEKAGLSSVDVLLGGPSCQGYSTIGKRIEEDPRNFLYAHYIRLVAELQPSWLVFENVRGMLLSGKGRFLKELERSLQVLGYQTIHRIVNAADYGVPQRRERLILIGTRLPVELTFPEPTHEDPRCSLCARPDGSKKIRQPSQKTDELFPDDVCPKCHGTRLEPRLTDGRVPWVSLWEAIGDLAPIGERGGSDDMTPYDSPAFSPYQEEMRSGAAGYTFHKARPVSAFAKSLISKIPPGNGIRAIPEMDLPERFRIMRRLGDGSLRRDCTTLYYRLSKELPSYTITCYFSNVSSGAFTHPEADRALTVREGARLQSFPDKFVFASTHLHRQIGNAVPPVLARAVANHILKLMTQSNTSISGEGKRGAIIPADQQAVSSSPRPLPAVAG